MRGTLRRTDDPKESSQGERVEPLSGRLSELPQRGDSALNPETTVNLRLYDIIGDMRFDDKVSNMIEWR